MKAKLVLPIFLMFAVLVTVATAQTTDYTVGDESRMVIEGTSTIHDWESAVGEMNFDIKVNDNYEGEEDGSAVKAPFTALSLEIPVKTIDSGKGKMNKKIYGALKEKDHPAITFRLANAELVEGTVGEGSFTMNVSGNLNIAGITRRVEFPVQADLTDNGVFNVNGSYDLNMKDYKVDPPSAMLGTVKSGKEVSIHFDLQLEPQGNLPTASN